MNTKTAQELAEQMLAAADAGAPGSDYDAIVVTRFADGTYGVGDNGEGVDELTRERAKAVIVSDLLVSVQYRGELAEAIYGIVSGADNTDEIDATESEICGWLADGDLDGSETAEQLAAMYIEYCETAAEAIEE